MDKSLLDKEISIDKSILESDVTSRETYQKESDLKNVAAQMAIADSERDPVEAYLEMAQLELGDLAREAQTYRTKKAMQDSEDLVDTLGQMAANKELSEEDLPNAVQATAGLVGSPTDSLTRMAEKLHLESVPDETEAEAQSLLDISNILAPLVELQKEKQKAYNLLRIGNDGKEVSIGNNLGDFAEALLPFSEQIFHTQLIDAIHQGDVGLLRKALYFGLQGEGKIFNIEKWENSSMEEKVKFAKALPALLQTINGITFLNDNDLLQFDAAQTIMEPGYYTGMDRALDNIVSVLDSSVILSPIAKGISAATRAARLAKLENRTYRSTKQPASPRAIAEKVNPNKAADLHTLEMSDLTDETAKVVSGTSRNEAAVDAVAPQVRVADNSVEDIPFALDKDLLTAVTDEVGASSRTPAELEATIPKISKELASIKGIKSDPQLSTAPELLDNGKIKINQVFTKGTGSFKSPEEAMNTAMLSLRNYGVTEESLTLLRKSDDGWIETTAKEVLGIEEARNALRKKKSKIPEELKRINNRNEFAVRVNTEYTPDAFQVFRENLDVKRNFIDRAPVSTAKGGSILSRWFLPAQSMLSKVITRGASTAVDQSNRLHKLLAEKSDDTLRSFDSLSTTDKQIADSLLLEQALQGRYFSKGELIEDGISESVVNVLQSWKKTNDQYWHLSNYDLVTGYRNRGFSLYVDKGASSTYLVKPVDISSAKKADTVYDPVEGVVKKLSAEQVDELYKNGGTLSRFRGTEEFNGVEATHIVSTTKDPNRYVRALKDDDKLLSYKPGHSFTVRYKDPYFIETFKVGEDGLAIEGTYKPLYTSPDKKTAIAAVERLKDADPSVGYRFRHNSELNIDETMDARYDMATNAKMTSQKHRGETIPQYRIDDPDLQYSIQSPIESMKVTMRELSNRIPMRNYLDELEARWMSQYGRLAGTEKNIFGRQAMPRSSQDFKTKKETNMSDKEYADAKTTLEYYNMMKYGYHNSLDRGWRRTFNWLGDFVGTKTTFGEKFFRGVAEEVASPVGTLRSLAFNQWIAASMPSSQWLVQGVPALANMLLHPEYVFKFGLAKDMSTLTLGILSRNNKMADNVLKSRMAEKEYKEMKQLVKEWDASGLGAGIDKHLIVENGLDHLIESGRWRMGKAAYNETFNRLRQAGFDVGEFINLSSYWLGTRNDAIKAGKDVTNPRVVDEIRGKTRDLTLNMNKAGEMPWNKNSLSVITQFLISPYKGISVFLNRGLTGKERAKLFLWNAVSMPMPAYFAYQLRSNFEMNDEIGELATNGIAGGLINLSLKAMVDEDTSISFARLNQVDLTMPWELAHSVLTQDLTTTLSQSPSLSSLIGHNPVVANFIKTGAKYISSPFKDMEDEERTQLMLATMNSFANTTALGRSISTAWKEMFIENYTHRYNSLGITAKENLTAPETFAKVVFGLTTTLESQVMQAGRDNYSETESARKDMLKFFTELSRAATDSGFNIDDPGREEYMMRMFFEAFPEGELPPKQQEMFDGLLRASYKKGEAPILNQVIKSANWLGREKALEVSRALKDLSPEAQAAFDWVRSEEAFKEMKEFANE